MAFLWPSGPMVQPFLLWWTSSAALGWPSADISRATQEGTMWSSGLTLATGVLLLLLACLAYAFLAVILRFAGRAVPAGSARLGSLVPALSVIGLAVALYLSYVETQAVPAMCGPIGDCNTVQQSPYARLFGIIPVGVVGAVGYIVILGTWLWGSLRNDRLAHYVPLALAGLSAFGALYSAYLTYLEVFVLRAVCIWCLASAVIMAVLLLVTIGPALRFASPHRTASPVPAEPTPATPAPSQAAARSVPAARKSSKKTQKKRSAHKGGGR